MNRRSVLRFLGATPIMGRSLEAKLKHDLNTGNLSGIHGVGGLSQQHLGPSDADPISSGNLPSNRLAMQFPWFRDELRSLLLEELKRVRTLDPDLAVLRSVSLSAKIYYQRQRNVDAAMAGYGVDPPWFRINALWSKIRGLIGA